MASCELRRIVWIQVCGALRGPRLAPSGERCESQSPVSNGQSRAGAPTGAGDEVNGRLRTEADRLDWRRCGGVLA